MAALRRGEQREKQGVDLKYGPIAQSLFLYCQVFINLVSNRMSEGTEG
jgi:hypothetical protein